MEKIINYENLSKFCYSNDSICVQPIKRIIVAFYGLGGMMMINEHNDYNKYLASLGIVYIQTYLNPWNWMNKEAVGITDEILDVLFEKYNLSDDLPIISFGGSMGGLCALTYTRYAKRTPHACLAICPVCDLPYHFTERVDLPRTLYSAYYNYDGTMQEALESASPVHLVKDLPNIHYCIYHTTADKAVNIDKHSEVLVKKMKELNKDVTFIKVPDRGHCDIPQEQVEEYRKFLETI